MLTRRFMLTAIVGLMLGLTSLVRAEDKPKEKPNKPMAALTGAIVSADDSSVVVKSKGKDVTVAVDANTKVTIDRKDATLGDLKPGMMVAVSNVDGPAKEIKARTSKPKDGAKKKPAEKKPAADEEEEDADRDPTE